MEDESTKVWRPGEVNITKITRGFPYLVVPGFAPPPTSQVHCPNSNQSRLSASESSRLADCCVIDGPRPISKATRRWARVLERRKAQRDQRRTDNSAIESAIQSAMLDSGSSSTFIQNANGLERTGPSNIVVSTANGSTLTTSGQVSLPLSNLSQGARTAHVLPGLKPKALMSVRVLADNGYTVIFHPHQQGVTVHDDIKLTSSRPAVLQGWRDASGMWTVPIVDEADVTPSLNVDESAMSVYELPSTKEVVRFLHAALGFPPKATLLIAACNKETSSLSPASPPKISPSISPSLMKLQKGT